MASDLTVLARIRARDEMDAGIKSARRRLDAFQRHARYAAGAAILAVGELARRGISQVIGVAEQTESLRATLHAVTGSANEAAAAFANMERFASQLPFQVEELVQAFIKLKAFGLGSIPARAGEPHCLPPLGIRPWVYPRTCGGTGRWTCSVAGAGGLSPHVRGNLYRATQKD